MIFLFIAEIWLGFLRRERNILVELLKLHFKNLLMQFVLKMCFLECTKSSCLMYTSFFFSMETWIKKKGISSCENLDQDLVEFLSQLIFWLEVLMFSKFPWLLTMIFQRIEKITYTGKVVTLFLVDFIFTF